MIIGCKGNLGGQLKEIFTSDFEVVAWDKEELDITKERETESKIKELKPEIIINAAAYNAVDKCEESEEEFESLNRAVARLSNQKNKNYFDDYKIVFNKYDWNLNKQ